MKKGKLTEGRGCFGLWFRLYHSSRSRCNRGSLCLWLVEGCSERGTWVLSWLSLVSLLFMWSRIFLPMETAAHIQGGSFLVNLGDAHTPEVLCASALDVFNPIKLAHTTVARCSWLELTRLKSRWDPLRGVFLEDRMSRTVLLT